MGWGTSRALRRNSSAPRSTPRPRLSRVHERCTQRIPTWRGKRKHRLKRLSTRAPILLVESKWSDAEIDRGLRYLKQRFPSADAWQISAVGKKDYRTPEGVRVAPAVELLKKLA